MNDFVETIEKPNADMNNLRSEDLDGLLNKYFTGRVVRKDLTKQLKEGANGLSTFLSIYWVCIAHRMTMKLSGWAWRM